jgi:lysophospholipase L1-like esterase
MRTILVYGDSLSWGIIPDTRKRFEFEQRWPGVLENKLNAAGMCVRVVEDCLNGRRTVWEDPFKPGRNGLQGLAQRMEIHSPLALVILMLGTNDFQFCHPYNDAWAAAQGVAALVREIRKAPIEPGMAVAEILIVCPPATSSPKGAMAEKFRGADERCAGLAQAFRQISGELECHFFDAGKVTMSSKVDGVHLDADQHLKIGTAISETVSSILKKRCVDKGGERRAQ